MDSIDKNEYKIENKMICKYSDSFYVDKKKMENITVNGTNVMEIGQRKNSNDFLFDVQLNVVMLMVVS